MSRFLFPFRMQKTGWFLLLICIVLGFQVGEWQLGLPAAAFLLASLLLHEFAHMVVATFLWVPVREFGLKLGGAYNRRAYATRRRDEILISAAGPVMNLLLVVPLSWVPHIGPSLAISNFFLAIINLLPLPSSDGLRILTNLWSFTKPRALSPILSQPSQP